MTSAALKIRELPAPRPDDYQRVRGALEVRAGKAHTVVDDSSFLTAKNASIVTEETMSINGNEIHLG
jgi:hypothetical protein